MFERVVDVFFRAAGKERNFTGTETYHVQAAGNCNGPLPGLQLQFHPTCSVEKPDQVRKVLPYLPTSGGVG